MSARTVLVTGATGYVATHVVKEFLEHGYNVVGSVRSQSSVERVKKTFAKYGSRFSTVIVPDIAVAGAHDEAVKGVDGVIHVASPFVLDVQDNEKDLLQPAIEGTTGILKSIAEYNSKVKRVVITSSFAAMANYSRGAWPEHTYSEADWNPVTYEEAKAGDSVNAYLASKTLAEKAAFEFVEKNKANFTIATLQPPMIYGPAEQAEDLSKLNTSAADIYRLMNGSEKEVPTNLFWAYVDVRDVATAHLLSFEKQTTTNERYFISPSIYSYQQIVDVLRQIPSIRDRVPSGKPGSGIGADTYKIDTSKAQNELGLKYTAFEKTFTDMANQFITLEQGTA